jgi:hypothetical protein
MSNELQTTNEAPDRAINFAAAQREAKALASSDLVPTAYKNNVANTLLAMEVAHRVGASPLAVMQNLNVVQGRPTWSSSFLIACVNSCGRFSPLRFEVRGGDDASAKTYAVRAISTDKESGKDCTGSWITWAMVEAEGWSKKAGSKWLTMPEQMFMYRAAAFWSRVFAPEISLGMHTADEVDDFRGNHRTGTTTISLSPAQMSQAKAELSNGNTTVDDISDKMPNLDPEQLDELTKHAAK